MLTQLTPDEFVVISADGRLIPGRTMVATLGFDAEKCKIVVFRSGKLCMGEEGLRPIMLESDIWQRVQ